MNIGNKKTQVVLGVAAVCAALAIVIVVLVISEPKSTDDGTIPAPVAAPSKSGDDVADPVVDAITPVPVDSDFLGCYVIDEYLYVNPASSASYIGRSPLVYGFGEDSVIIANTEAGDARRHGVQYYKAPIGADEFTSVADVFPESLPDVSGFSERYLLAVITTDYRIESKLYAMDSQLWLADFSGTQIWTIQRLVKTVDTTRADLERAIEAYEYRQQLALSTLPRTNPLQPEPQFKIYENQMTMKDVYALARKAEALTLGDFEPFLHFLTGTDFTERRYDIAGADTVFVTIGENGGLLSARLLSRRTFDESDTVDLRDGFEAVAQYLNPLRPFGDIVIEDTYGGGDERDMFFEDDYFLSQCRYYLDTKRADRVFVVLDNMDRMTIGQALEQRRVTVEQLVAHGLNSVIMVPIGNPLGGEFNVLQHHHRFWLNEEEFYPSTSFMYVIWAGGIAVYYDINELIDTLELYGYDAQAEALGFAIDPADVKVIAGNNYVRDTVIEKAGVVSHVGWVYSSHTPVWFTVSVLENH